MASKSDNYCLLIAHPGVLYSSASVEWCVEKGETGETGEHKWGVNVLCLNWEVPA